MSLAPCLGTVEPIKNVLYGRFKKLADLAQSFHCPVHAYATTYYIDSELGDDTWSGKLSARAAGTSLMALGKVLIVWRLRSFRRAIL